MTFSSISQKITFSPEFNQIDDLGNGIKKSQKTEILEAIEKTYVKSSIAREMFDKWVITDKKTIQIDYMNDTFAASKTKETNYGFGF